MGNYLQIKNTGLDHCYINGLPIVEAEVDMAEVYKKVARVSSLAVKADPYFTKHTQSQKIFSESHGEGDRITRDFLEEGAREILPIFIPFQRWIPEGAFDAKPLSYIEEGLTSSSIWNNPYPLSNFATEIEIEVTDGAGSANIIVNGDVIATAYFDEGTLKYEGNIRNENQVDTIEIELEDASGDLNYDNYDLDISGEVSLPSGIANYNDKVYLLNRSDVRIYRYTIGANGDLTYDNYSLYVGSEVGFSRGMACHQDKLYLVNISDDTIHRYSIDSNGDLTYDNYNWDLSNECDGLNGLDFDGSKVYVTDNNAPSRFIRRYNLESNGDLTYDNYSLDISSDLTGYLVSLAISDGVMYVLTDAQNIHKYNIDTNGDISYAEYSIDISLENEDPKGITAYNEYIYTSGDEPLAISRFKASTLTISEYNYKITTSKYEGITWIKALAEADNVALPTVPDDIRVSYLLKSFNWNNVDKVDVSGVMIKHHKGSANVTINTNQVAGTTKELSSGTIGESYSEDVNSINVVIEDETDDFTYDVIINTEVASTIPSPRFEFDSTWNPGKIIFRYQNMDTRTNKLDYTTDTFLDTRIDPNTFDEVLKYIKDSLKNYVLKELYEAVGYDKKAMEYERKYEQSRRQAKFWVRSEKGLQID